MPTRDMFEMIVSPGVMLFKNYAEIILSDNRTAIMAVYSLIALAAMLFLIKLITTRK